MQLWEILVLAVVQGITEFLPISSDGHLIITAALLPNTKTEVASLVVTLHMGTLASIIVFYWRRVLDLLTQDRRLIPLLIVATIPAVLFGLPIKTFAEWILESPLLAGICLPITGLVLLWSSRQPEGKTDYRELTTWQAWWLGCAQAAAILPGWSRSGSTISAGLTMGLKRQSAATFSFLMAIPAISGAGVLELLKMFGVIKMVKEMIKGPSTTPEVVPTVPPIDPTYLLLAGVVSFVVGLGALWVLVKMLERGQFSVFAWYCIALGIAVICWQLGAFGG